ncbi:hypothetical protein RJ639_042886 [Escallonia herrerae]|uniref:Uncharacterized protein n=1 Tax=Escallonia herrerae TaxID=1293975 RepID=A0AA88WJS7_9ASTE|nr:hypothetical protein RJ639_042886 [Escallonia herrerae]
MEEPIITSPSLKHRLKQTLCSSCCFGPTRSPAWVTGRVHELPEMKEKCRSVFGRSGNRHRRRHSSADFRYDPLSYSLNFEDGFESGFPDEEPLKSFASRMPASPPRLKSVMGL